jgi:aspartate aminotransferase
MTLTTGGWSPAARVTELARVSTRPTISDPPVGTVSLAMGEPDFSTPEPIVEAAAKALCDGHTHYADQYGLPELREAIAAGLPAAGRAPWSGSEVLVTHGATGGLTALLMSMVGPGDRVVIPEPTYSLYADLVTVAGGVVDFVPLTADLRLDMDRLRDALPGARALVLCNPSNPTGTVLTRAELAAVGDLVAVGDTVVVVDEAYEELLRPGVVFTSALEVESLAGRIVQVQTFSKTYAMTGWRVGHLAGPSAVIEAAARLHRTFVGSLNTAVQYGALRALELDGSAVAAMVAAYDSRRELVETLLAGSDDLFLHRPEGTFYVFVRYHTGVTAGMEARALAERGVLVRPGTEFGPSGEGHLRLSCAASPEDLRTGLARLTEHFARGPIAKQHRHEGARA